MQNHVSTLNNISMEKSYFYNKFVDEENLKNISDAYVQDELYFYFGLLPFFLIISVGAVAHFGYNILFLATAISFLFALASLYMVVRYTVCIILYNNKYHIFRKLRYLIIFLSIYFVLAIPFYILSIFTVKYSIDDAGNVVGLSTNVFWFYVIFLPLIIGYAIFCYFACGKCFSKYAINKKIKQKEDIEVIQIENTNYFYNKFVNEENLRNIGDENIWNKLSMYFVTIPILPTLSVIVIIVFPFVNFVSIWIAFLLLLITCKCVDGFSLVDIKHKIFKKHKQLNIFLSVYIILAILFCVLHIASAKYDTDLDAFVPRSSLISIIYLYAYSFLSFGHIIFTYHAYGKCILKYVKIGLLYKKEKEEVVEVVEKEYEYDEEEDEEESLNTYNRFYNTFVDEDVLKSIEDVEEQNKFSKYDTNIPFWLLVSTFCITYAGYSFEHWYNTLLFVCAILSFLASLCYTIGLISLDRKHHVFIKHAYLHLFLWIYFILSIAIYIVVYFDIKFNIRFISPNEISGNLIFLWCIYLPLHFIYDRFTTHAYKDCLLEYTKDAAEYRARKNKNNKKNENKNKYILNQKESEEWPSDSNDS